MNPSQDPHLTSALNRGMTQIGWDLVRNALSGLTASPVTQNRCQTLTPTTDFESAKRLLRETEEMVALLESVEGFPIRGFDDIGVILEETGEKLLADPRQCLNLINFLRLVRDIQRFLDKKSTAPILQDHGQGIVPLPPLAKELDRCIDKDGEIRENASPELKRAIREAQSAKQNIENTVKKILADPAYEDVIQESYFTEREGRVVLPIKAEGRSKIEGIVHDSSGSGATLFMEPTKIIPLNNQLKMSLIRVEQEKIKVLGHLAREILNHKQELVQNQEILTTLDLIHARARLAGAMQAHPFCFTKDGGVNLREARNPELVLNKQNTVANDISWDAATRAVMISGPNTGGKTVTLKTVGLMSLMSRAGLFLPVKPDSQISFFPEVHVDIGDDQSIQLSLSTYSAHIEKIIRILSHAQPGSLILLDELGISTDPQEGAALAEAILLELKRKGMMTMVSTHYLALKTLAQTHEGFLNICAEFDLETLSPTYKLIAGVPGNSAALDTAERIGLPRDIILKARNIHAMTDNRAENLLQDLNRQKLELAREKEALADQKEETQRLLDEQTRIASRLRDEEREFQKTRAQRLQTQVKEARNKIRKMIEEIRQTGDLAKIRKTEKEIAGMTRVPLSVLSDHVEGWDVPVESLKEGDAVMVNGYGAKGILLEDPAGKKKVRVRLGNLPTRVEAKRLKGNSRLSSQKTKPVETGRITVQSVSVSAAKLNCDLRGMRLEEARSMLDLFFNQALLNKTPKVTIIHGHGTNTIKKMVRDYCETTKLWKSFGPGEQQEGGDGVTIIYFD